MPRLAAVFSLLLISFLSCKDDEITNEEILSRFVRAKAQEIPTIVTDWSAQDLSFLSEYVDKSVIGLGEATHGTSEFFASKSAIFKYLVQNHGFKVLAIEADVGESILINEAIQNSNTPSIRNLMIQRMKFWVWKTEEVLDLLEWMSEYNRDQPASEKLQYIGVDCQYNEYNVAFVRAFLQPMEVGIPFNVDSILTRVDIDSRSLFRSYTKDQFVKYLQLLNDLRNYIDGNASSLISSSSESEYLRTIHLMDVIIQSSEVIYSYTKNLPNPRDEYMAENTVWIQNDIPDTKIAIWAHNAHIFRNQNTRPMGYFLSTIIGENYASIGFMFSKGSFNGVDRSVNLKRFCISEFPKSNSINAIFSNSGLQAFAISSTTLYNEPNWKLKINEGVDYFQIGALYENSLAEFYTRFSQQHYDIIIYFDASTPTKLLR